MCNDVGDSAHRRLAFSAPKWRFSRVNYCQTELSQNYFESNSSLFVIFLPICYKCVFFCDVYFTFYTVSSRAAALGVGHIEKAGKREKEERRSILRRRKMRRIGGRNSSRTFCRLIFPSGNLWRMNNIYPLPPARSDDRHG